MDLGGLEILLVQTLRDIGESSSGEIFSEVKKKRNIAYTSVTTTLYRLVDKGILKIRKESKKKIYYSINENGERYKSLVQKMTTGVVNAFGSQAISYLVENAETLSSEDIEKLRKTIEKIQQNE